MCISHLSASKSHLKTYFITLIDNEILHRVEGLGNLMLGNMVERL